jgi:GntR family transcriptional regulator
MTTYYDLQDTACKAAMVTTLKKPLLSRSSPEPLYRQLAQHIEGAIRNGQLKLGDRLDSESVLSHRFAISRITVRQAIEELVQQQIVVRKQGKGTFVTQPAVKHDLRRLHGLLGSLFSQAEAASTKLLRYELIRPPREVADALGLLAGQQAVSLDRLYQIGRRPVVLAQGWLVPEVATLPRAKAELLSTEDMMRDIGIHIASSQVSIRAEAAGAMPGRLLKLSARAPVLVLRRTAIGTDGRTKETNRVWFCSDAYELVCATGNAGFSERLFEVRNVEERL